jgi:acyl-CoA synthetase (AMP-forming)/AMP-acid ligase II
MLNTTMTMFEAFYQVAEPRRKQLAMVCGDKRLTYAALLNRTQRLAMGLQSFGIHKGDRVAALLSPGPDFSCLFFALAEIGAVFMPLNPQLRSRSLGQVLNDAEPVLLVTEQPLEESSVSLPASLQHIILTDQPVDSTPSLEGLVSFASSQATSLEAVTPDDLLALLYTSGTTGVPKGTMHSHRSLIAPVAASLKVRELWLKRLTLKSIGETAKALARYKTRLLRVAGRPQVFLSTVGWHAITGIEVMLQALLMGDTIVVLPHFHPRQTMELIQKEKVTILVAIPTAYQAILSLEDFDQFNTSSLLICGTGAMPCSAELGRKIQERFHCALHIGFGSTEMAGGVAIPSIGDSNELQATTVGKPLPGVQIKIVDDQHNELPIGQVGELLCRGDMVMQGYFRAPEATSDVIDKDGWYSTGDMAKMDEDGYLYIMGRKKDMIIRSGQNIYPAEIEAYLVTHPDIQEAAVIGMPSTLSGEEVWAFIIPRPGADLSPRQVLDYCRKELEAFRIPNQVRIVKDFPRTEIGKPQKYLLKAGILAELGKDK